LGFLTMAKPRNEAGSTDHTADLQPSATPAREPFAGTVKGDGSALAFIAPSLHALIVPIDSVQPMPGNARAHGERDLSAIAESLRDHGQQRPIVVKAEYRGTERAIMAGCGTWMAAKRLGWPFIAVSWFTGTDADAAAYSVRDNRTSELSRFDASALAALSADAELDLLSLGWTGAELGDLLALADGDAVPHFEPVEQPVGRLDRLEPHCATCRCREAK
jgi:ParB-like chromosome segregation protein Spo0J